MSTDSRPGPFEGDTSENLRASDVMIPVSRTCSPFSTLTEAALILKDQGPGMVPVVDLGKPVGMVTDRDVAQASRRAAGARGSSPSPMSWIVRS